LPAKFSVSDLNSAAHLDCQSMDGFNHKGFLLLLAVWASFSYQEHCWHLSPCLSLQVCARVHSN